jgi:hypothetical protein
MRRTWRTEIDGHAQQKHHVLVLVLCSYSAFRPCQRSSFCSGCGWQPSPVARALATRGRYGHRGTADGTYSIDRFKPGVARSFPISIGLPLPSMLKSAHRSIGTVRSSDAFLDWTVSFVRACVPRAPNPTQCKPNLVSNDRSWCVRSGTERRVRASSSGDLNDHPRTLLAQSMHRISRMQVRVEFAGAYIATHPCHAHAPYIAHGTVRRVQQRSVTTNAARTSSMLPRRKTSW